jgi:Ca2+-transporting ATPase
MVANNESQTNLNLNNAAFSLSCKELSEIVETKNKKAVDLIGGVNSLISALRTSKESGLSPDEHFANDKVGLQERTEFYGRNKLPEIKQTSFFSLVCGAFNDKTLVFLSIASIVSLGIGLFEDFYLHKDSPEPKIKWIDGVSISIAVIVVVLVSSVNDYKKEKQFRALNAKHDDREVKLIRLGKESLVSVFDVKVGDIALLEPGDVLTVDGVIFQSHNLKCDESSATGESELVKKQPYSSECEDCFILSGSKVAEGVGRFVVTAVGPNTYHGKTLLSLRVESEDTPLQVKLNALAEKIARVGFSISILMFIILMIKFLVDDVASKPAEVIVTSIVAIVIQCITIVVVAVPEGLPLAVTLALAYATKKMLKDNNLVRVLSSCETMGNATTICSDKTGTLTQNKMTVVEAYIGTVPFSINSTSFKDSLHCDFKPSNEKKNGIFTPKEFQKIIIDGIAVNSTAFENESGKEKVFVGSTTEIALLNFCVSIGMPPGGYHNIRSDFLNQIVQVYPFSSQRKTMTTVLKMVDAEGKSFYRVYSKGASEYIIKASKKYVCFKDDCFTVVDLEKPDMFMDKMATFANKALRTIGICYKDMTESEYNEFFTKKKKVNLASIATIAKSKILSDMSEFEETKPQPVDEELPDPSISDMVLVGILGIQDPLRPTVCDSVKKCQQAGIFVRMVTGDNLPTGN